MDDPALVALLQSGDQNALELLLQQYGPLLRYVIAPILENPLDREECFSDAAMRIWEKIGTFDPQRGSLRAFCVAIAHNTAVNRRKSLASHEADALPETLHDPAPSVQEQLAARERLNALLDAVSTLGHASQVLFYRKYYYEQSNAQIARELGITERAVEGKLYRLRTKLRRLTGGMEHD